jgi:hypothetical protein
MAVHSSFVSPHSLWGGRVIRNEFLHAGQPTDLYPDVPGLRRSVPGLDALHISCRLSLLAMASGWILRYDQCAVCRLK